MKKIFFYLLISYLPSSILQASSKSYINETTSSLPSTNIIVDAISPPDWDKTMQEVEQSLASFFQSLQKNYETSIEELNPEKLESTLNKLENSDSSRFFPTVQHYIQQNGGAKQKRIIEQIDDYKKTKKKLDDKIGEIYKEITTNGLINAQTEIKQYRRKYYEKIKKKLLFLQKVTKSAHVHPDRNEIVKDVIQKLAEGLELETKKIKHSVEDNQWNSRTLSRFNQYELCLADIDHCFKRILGTGPGKRLNEFENIVEKKIEEIIKKNRKATHKRTATTLIKLKRIGNHLERHQVAIDIYIDKVLYAFKEENKKNNRALGMLSDYLERDKTGIGQSIIAEHTVLKGERQKIFAQKMKSYGWVYVAANIKGDHINKTLLSDLYGNFRKKYESLLLNALNDGQNNKPDINKITANAFSIAGNEEQVNGREIKWDYNTRTEKIPKLLAHIFAVWTLQESTAYRESNDNNKTGLSDYLRQPHVAQVICIFRLLGVDEKNPKNPLPNNFAQVGTGEGKSLIAGAVACILSLLGFNHKSACYSHHLVQRDFNSFKDLFTAFGVLKHIQYSTFQELCEDMINQEVNVREAVANFILEKDEDDEKKIEDDEKEDDEKETEDDEKKQKWYRQLLPILASQSQVQSLESGKKHRTLQSGHTILFVDEVDVFINSLYGKCYTPVSQVQSPEIEQLIRYIWNQRDTISFYKLINSSQYKACCTRLSKWKPLIREACKDIIYAFASAKELEKNKDYIVKNDQIGYKDEDTIRFNVHYGYTTLRNYFFENEQKNISDESLQKNIALYINCGTFSFAEVIKEYSRIIGVTGTLEALSKKQKQIVKDVYKVKKSTYMPSLYGKSKFEFFKKCDIKIVPREEHYQALIREINKRMIGRMIRKGNDDEKQAESYPQEAEKRAVLVVFENSKLLNRFYSSEEFLAYQIDTQRMTQELTFQERENCVRQATRAGKITLLEKSFARGVDFVCYDRFVNKNGGPHLIMTFVAEEYAEEVQGHGRVARQSGPGSASWCLCEEDLEKFGIKDKTEIESMIENQTSYEVIDRKRNEYFDVKYEDEIQHVAKLAEEHKKALALRDALKGKNKEKALEYLRNYNLGTSEAKKIRGVVAIDATGSMGNSLRKAKNAVVQAFENTRSILAVEKKAFDCFEIQFAFYRNYNSCENELLEHSNWEVDPQNLRTYTKNVSTSGGWGNEAVEVVLEHVLREQEKSAVSFVLLIGDARPNTEDEIVRKRKDKGESYWQATSFFKKVLHVDKLLPKLKKEQIAVHAFWTDKRAESAFKKIASQTGGSSGFFNADSSAGTNELTDILSQAVLDAIGGKNLVKSYVKKFDTKTYL